MMGGSLIPGFFAPLMQGMSENERHSLARQMSQHANALARQAAVEAIYKPMVSTGPGLLPKDLIPDLETAADIPARIARMVETLIDSRKPAPSTARQQLGFNQLGGMRRVASVQ